MSSFNLVQIVPSLNSGGVERGTVDVANFLAENKIHNFIIFLVGRSVATSIFNSSSISMTSKKCM